MFEKFRGGGTILGSDLETANGEIFERGVDKFRHRGRLCGLTNLKKREGKREGGREGGREGESGHIASLLWSHSQALPHFINVACRKVCIEKISEPRDMAKL